MTDSDHLSNEISLSGKIDEKGLTAGVKSRTIAALDRLLGNLVDVPNAFLERYTRETRAKGERSIRLLDVEADIEAEIIASDQRYHEIISAKVVEAEARKQKNKTDIALLALEHLGNQDDTQKENTDSIEADWLNYFEDYAEKASSERMQDLWSRILAGEIRKPGAYSLSTMRFLSELDAKIAEIFQRRMENRMPDGYLPRPNRLEGEELSELMFLEEIGLLQDAAGNITVTLNPNEDGMVYYRIGEFLLIFETKQELRLNVIPITRVGRELLTILPSNDAVAAIEYAITEILKTVDSAKIANIFAELPDGRFQHRDIKILKSKATE